MPVTLAEIELIEKKLGLVFPPGLKKIYLEFDKSPANDVFVFDGEGYIVRLLPLVKASYTALDAYRFSLEQERQEPQYFPFAYDPGGNDFYVDCSSPEGLVSFCCHEICDDEEDGNIIDFGVGIEDFWDAMVTAEVYEASDDYQSRLNGW